MEVDYEFIFCIISALISIYVYTQVKSTNQETEGKSPKEASQDDSHDHHEAGKETAQLSY